MNMLSGVEGIDANFEAGKHQRYDFTLDMTTTNMEEINDLEVAVWVQSYESKEIHNSRFLNEYTAHLYPVQNLSIKENKISWEAPEQGNPVEYNVFVNGKSVKKTTETSYTITAIGKVAVEVFAVYENETSSVGVSLFTEIEKSTGITDVEQTQYISIYPNPANDRLYIEAEAEIEEAVVYDIYGKAQNLRTSESHNLRISVDLSNLNAGIYFIKINTNEGNIVKQFIKR